MPVLVERFVVVGDTDDAKAAAQLWQFISRAFKTYFNVRDPQSIQQRVGEELPLDQVYSKWPVSTDSEVHRQSSARLVHERRDDREPPRRTSQPGEGDRLLRRPSDSACAQAAESSLSGATNLCERVFT